MKTRADHGWGPYWVPMLAFLLLVEIGRRAPAAAQPAFLVLKSLVPGALFAGYALRQRYPELRGGPGGAAPAALDALVGLAGAALWMAPYLLFPALRPEPGEAFDPQLFGPSRVGLALAVRALGFGLVTPFVEELFVRSWLARYADVFDRRQDFRGVPLARFTRRSFAAVVVYFTFSHVPWEYPVALAWVVGTQLWFYRRKNLPSLVIVHAASNLGILAAAALLSGRLVGPDGEPLDLWFFL